MQSVWTHSGLLLSEHLRLKSMPLPIHLGPERAQGDGESNNFRQTVSYGARKNWRGRKPAQRQVCLLCHTAVVWYQFFLCHKLTLPLKFQDWNRGPVKPARCFYGFVTRNVGTMHCHLGIGVYNTECELYITLQSETCLSILKRCFKHICLQH